MSPSTSWKDPEFIQYIEKAVKDSSTTLDGNTLKGFISCTYNIVGMADQDAQLKTQTEDFFGRVHEQISFDSA